MNRKMKANAAKQVRRDANNGTRRSVSSARCDTCGGHPVANYALVDLDTAEVLKTGSLCDPPSREELH